jgi:hypothetical protein
MVAKSYQNFKIVNGPYKRNGREYVVVEAPKGQKEVRWYPDKPTTYKIDDARARFGFCEDGNIYAARGTEDALERFFTIETRHFGRFSVYFGWYIGSWVKQFPKEDTINMLNRAKELGIKWYRIPYSSVSDKNGSFIAPTH